jgi:hypothetical protein
LRILSDTSKTVDVNDFYQELRNATIRILDQARNMNNADVSNIELVDIPLDGVRWSESTRWPDHWRDQIRARSLEIEPGFFEIRLGGTVWSLGKVPR